MEPKTGHRGRKLCTQMTDTARLSLTLTHTHLSTRVLSSWPSGYTGVLGAPVVSGKPRVKSWPRAESLAAPWQPQEGQGVLPTPLRTAWNSSAQSTITQAPQTSGGVAERALSPVHPQTRKGPGERRSQVHMAGRSVSWLPTPPSAAPPPPRHTHITGAPTLSMNPPLPAAPPTPSETEASTPGSSPQPLPFPLRMQVPYSGGHRLTLGLSCPLLCVSEDAHPCTQVHTHKVTMLLRSNTRSGPSGPLGPLSPGDSQCVEGHGGPADPPPTRLWSLAGGWVGHKAH